MIMRCTQAPSGKAALAAQAYSMALPRLETDRLILRAPTLQDLPHWTEIYTVHFGKPDDAEAAWTEFNYYTAGWLLHGHGMFAIDRKDDGSTIGFVMLGLEWGDIEPELGWMLIKEARGFGYATEAATAVRDFSGELLGPDGFVSYIDHDNAASAKVARRLGGTRDAGAEHVVDQACMVFRYAGTHAPGRKETS